MTAELPVLTTPRLLLRPLDLSDVAAVQRLFPRWEIVRFLTSYVPWPYPDDGALTFIRDVALPGMRQGREWHWSIRRRVAADQLIGVISLMDRPDDNRGFWLDPAWQRQGLMAEASVAATDYWFDTLARPVLRVLKATANVASRRISEGSHMRLIATGERDFVSGRQTDELWEITRDEWHAQRKAARCDTQDRV